jgi:hypothetical protein
LIRSLMSSRRRSMDARDTAGSVRAESWKSAQKVSGAARD